MPTTCPSCGAAVDASTEINDPTAPIGTAAPPANSVAICFYCTTINIYTGVGIEQRAATADELVEYASDPEVQRIQRAVRQYRKENNL